jgi:hypothetical protein
VTARRLSYAIGLVALIAAGFYVFIYLYRWEWNRALVAGVIFLAAEIALASALLFERIKRLEQTIKKQAPSPDVLEQIKDSAPESSRPFAWLQADRDNLSVFVPVLMGAGVVISAIAWLVERLATFTAKPVLEKRLAMRLAPVSVPPGVLTAGTDEVSIPPSRNRLGFLARPLIVVLAVIAVYSGLDLLGDLTQNRPDAMTSGSTALVLDVEAKSETVGRVEAARSVWAACSTTMDSDLTQIGRRSASLVLTVEPALGKYSFRRLKGCLEDATVDGIRADVGGNT